MSVPLKRHVEHMKLKNWAYSLFQPSQVLYHEGFTHIWPTPAISVGNKKLSPDLIAESGTALLILDAKAGKPDPKGDAEGAKRYLKIPLESLQEYTGSQIQDVEVVFLYSEENLQDTELKEKLTGKLTLERRIVVWSLDKLVGKIHLVHGMHSNSKMNKLLRSGLPVNLISPHHIYIQPDSSSSLIARELFQRLLQWSYRTRKKNFDLEVAQETLGDQVYGFSDREELDKLRRAIRIGERNHLCRRADSNIWKLNLFFGRPQSFLEKLHPLTRQRVIDEYRTSTTS